MATPVEWIEATYDTWERIDRVGGGILYRRTGSVYVQPMFVLKNDLCNPPPSRCLICAHGVPHHCAECGDEIAHMTGTLCPPCWDARLPEPEPPYPRWWDAPQ